jgi:hypothetical protein
MQVQQSYAEASFPNTRPQPALLVTDIYQPQADQGLRPFMPGAVQANAAADQWWQQQQQQQQPSQPNLQWDPISGQWVFMGPLFGPATLDPSAFAPGGQASAGAERQGQQQAPDAPERVTITATFSWQVSWWRV